MKSITAGIVFIEGIITFLSPCFLPLIPVYVGYISGEAMNQRRRWKAVKNSIGFILGFTLVFILLGATASAVGKYLLVHRRILNQVLGILVIIMGLFYMDILKIKFLNMEKRFNYDGEKASFIGAFILGAAVGFGWTPCIGPILGSVLALAASKSSVIYGIYLLLIYSIGIAVPFIITACLIQGAVFNFRKILKYNRIIKTIAGLILVLTGVALYTGYFERLSGFLGGFGL